MWTEFSQTFTVNDVIPTDFRLVVASVTDTVMTVLKLLKQHKLSAVPLFDAEKEKFVGFISYMDLIATFLFMDAGREIVEAFSQKPIDWVAYLEEEAKVIGKEVAASFTDLRKQAWVEVARTASLGQLCHLLAQHARVAVIDNGACVAVISRSRLISYLHTHGSQIAEISQFTVAEAGLDESLTVQACAASDTVGAAYAQMCDRQLTCLPVLAGGRLVGAISHSDLHGRDVKDLLLGFSGPVGAYVEKFAHSHVVGGAPMATCRREDTLAHVIGKLAKTHLHQLFVIDENNVVLAVCSLGDILRTLNDAL